MLCNPAPTESDCIPAHPLKKLSPIEVTWSPITTDVSFCEPENGVIPSVPSYSNWRSRESVSIGYLENVPSPSFVRPKDNGASPYSMVSVFNASLAVKKSVPPSNSVTMPPIVRFSTFSPRLIRTSLPRYTVFTFLPNCMAAA